jgi:hypothetical protein
MDTETGHARGSKFLLLGQAGPTRPGRAAACSGQRSLPLRSASAPGGWRATRGLVVGVVVVPSGRGRRALCGAAPPASSPRRVPIRPAPPRTDRWMAIITVARGSRPEGPDGSGVNGLTLGPLRLLGGLSPAGQGPAVSDTRLPLPPLAAATMRSTDIRRCIVRS